MVLADKASAISSRYFFSLFREKFRNILLLLTRDFSRYASILRKNLSTCFEFLFFFFLKSNLTENNILTKRRISILDQDVAKLAFYVRRILYIFLL